MALNLNRLEKVKKGPGGGQRARCPACASKGEDKQGQHLYIRADGKFGCAKYPKNKEHRSLIAKLAGDRKGGGSLGKQPIRIAIKPFKAQKHIPKGYFGTDGTPFSNLRAHTRGSKNTYKATANKQTVCEMDLEKPVPSVPKTRKSLSISKRVKRRKPKQPRHIDLCVDEDFVHQIDAIKNAFSRKVVAARDGEVVIGDWSEAK